MAPPSSTIRAFDSIIVRFSNGFSRKTSSSCSYHIPKETYGLALLCVWEGAPAKIPAERYLAFTQTAQDAKKSKLYARFGKEVVSAVKKGGSIPVSNTTFAALFEKAKDLDIPRDILDRNNKRASEKDQEEPT